jgi:hypothetical protein
MPAENFLPPVFTYIAVNPLQSPNAMTLPFPTLPARHCESPPPDGWLAFHFLIFDDGDNLKILV